MEQGHVHVPRQQNLLLRRAYDLLEQLGQPATEAQLITHLFNASGEFRQQKLWTTILRQTLGSSPLFEMLEASASTEEIRWALKIWRNIERLLTELDFVVLDVETTGTRPRIDRVIEIAGVRIRDGKTLATFQQLVNPQRRIPPFIEKFTGITSDMLADAPSIDVVLPEFIEFIEKSILVGHNVSFDLHFLNNEAQRLDLSFPLEGLDTIPLARRFSPGLKRLKLDMVARHLNIPITTRHRALGDAQTTAAVFIHLLELAHDQGITTLAHLKRRLQLPVAWNGDITQVKFPRRSISEEIEEQKTAAAQIMSRPNGSLFLNPAWKRTFPERPGVYLMKDAQGVVIYVGKAKCLKDRLSSYYSQPLGYTHKMDGLLQNVRTIETRVLGSELEALLVESQLIKELQPVYNVQLRNYELYPFIKVDVQHTYARVYATQEIVSDGARYFGPFRSRRLVDLTIELVQKIFPIRTCTRALPPQGKPSDPCLRLHLGRCSAPCRGSGDPVAYREVIDEVCAFLGGEREDLLDRLRRQMFEASQQLNFERAAWLRDTIRGAEEVLIGQRLISGAVEANNLFIIYPSAHTGYNEIFLIRHGRLVEQRCIEHRYETMAEAIHALLEIAARLGEPPKIVGKGEVDQINIISRWIHHHSGDRAFFPFQHILAGTEEVANFIDQIWHTVEATHAVATTEQTSLTDEVEGV